MCRRAVAEGSARVDLQLDAGIGGLEIGEVREKPALQEADRHPDRQRLLAGVAQERTGFLDLAQRRLHHVQVFPARPGPGDAIADPPEQRDPEVLLEPSGRATWRESACRNV